MNTPNESPPFQIKDFIAMDPNPRPKEVFFTKKLRVEEIEDTINSTNTSNLGKAKEEGRVSKINNFTNRSNAQADPLKSTAVHQQKTFKKSTSANRSQQKQQRCSSSEEVRMTAICKKHLNAEKLVRERK